MKYYFLSLIAFTFFSSCNTLKIAEDKNTTNVKSIGIQSNYKAILPDNIYKDSIELSIDKVIARFNEERHAFSVHKKTGADEAYMTMDFSKLKIVTNGGVAAGYIVTALGLVAAPILIWQASDKTFLLAFYYFPANKVHYTSSLSPFLSGERDRRIPNYIQTGAMFRSQSKRVDVTRKRFEDYLYKSLLNLEKQLEAH